MKAEDPPQILGKTPPGVGPETVRMPLLGRPGALSMLHFVYETTKSLEKSLRTEESHNPVPLGLAQPEGGSGIS